MITTIETRLKLNENQLNLIDSSIVLLSEHFRKSWIMFNNKKLSETDIGCAVASTSNEREKWKKQMLLTKGSGPAW